MMTDHKDEIEEQHVVVSHQISSDQQQSTTHSDYYINPYHQSQINLETFATTKSPHSIITVNNNSHNHNMINLVTKWSEYCIVLSKCHGDCSAYFRTMNFSVMIPAIVLSSASGLGSIISSTSKTCSTSGINWVTVGFGIAAIASSTMVTIHRYINLSDLQKEHDIYSDMFAALGNEASLHIALTGTDDQMYMSINEFAKHLKRQMDILIDKAPPILGFIAKRYNHTPSSRSVDDITMAASQKATHARSSMPEVSIVVDPSSRGFIHSSFTAAATDH